MNRSVVWLAVGAGVIGIGVPAYAASQDSTPKPTITTVEDTVTAGSVDDDDATTSSVDDSTTSSVDDSTSSSVDDSTSSSVDDSTSSSVDDSTSSSVDDDATEATEATENSVDDDAVDDVSGNCDEAEHADDPECAGTAAAGTVADNSGPGNTEQDNSGPGNADDSGHHNGGDDAGDDNGGDDHQKRLPPRGRPAPQTGGSAPFPGGG